MAAWTLALVAAPAWRLARFWAQSGGWGTPLAAAVAALLLARRLRGLATGRASPWQADGPGLGFLAAGHWLNAAGLRSGEWALSWAALPLVAVGLAGTCLGAEARRRALAPAAILVLAVPPPAWLHFTLGLGLKGVVAHGAVALLGMAGMPARLDGWTLVVGSRAIRVVEACSGARTQLGLVAVAAVILALRPAGPWTRWGTLASCLPAGLVASVLRLAALAAAAPVLGERGMAVAHDLSGLLVVVPGVLVLAAARRVLAAVDGVS